MNIVLHNSDLFSAVLALLIFHNLRTMVRWNVPLEKMAPFMSEEMQAECVFDQSLI